MATVLSSPMLPLLLELEDAARASGAELSITMTDTGRFHVAPTSVLTPERRAQIRAHRDAFRLLVHIASAAVQARATVFRRQLQTHRSLSVYPALRFTSDVTPGGCVSCGEPTSAPTWCGACQTAARLARDGDIPVEWAPVGAVTPRTAA